MVEGERFNIRAIALSDILADRATLISSRSESDKCCEFLVSAFGLIPPYSRKDVKTVPGAAATTRPISLNPVPCFHNLKTRSFFSWVNVRFARFIKITHANQHFTKSVALTI